MTLEEAIQRANEGDTKCMVMIGDYYGSNEDLEMVEQFRQALPWYERAAAVGDPNGLNKAAMIYDIWGAAHKDQGFWDSALDYYGRALANIDEILQYPNLNEKTVPSLIERKINDSYEVAFCKYVLEYDKLEIIESLSEVVKMENAIKPQMLVAVCSLNISSDTFRGNMVKENLPRIKKAFNESKTLLNIFETEDLTSVFSSLGFFEELELSKGYSYLSTFYQKNDPNRAYNILLRGYQAVKNDDIKKLFVDQLSHYKKKMFGGYQYIE